LHTEDQSSELDAMTNPNQGECIYREILYTLLTMTLLAADKTQKKCWRLLLNAAPKGSNKEEYLVLKRQPSLQNRLNILKNLQEVQDTGWTPGREW
jgi:hypothetical protein